MSGEQQDNVEPEAQPHGASADFTRFCEAEFERRRNSGEAFDEARYREAMAMVLRSLRALEAEGYQ